MKRREDRVGQGALHAEPAYSVIVPTCRRPEMLAQCLGALAALEYPKEDFEVRVYDNGFPEISRETAQAFASQLNLVYTLNEPGHGLGYSLQRGAAEARGRRILEVNDDALVPPGVLRRLDEIFALDPRIGVVGFRALEDHYTNDGDRIGVIDTDACKVIGNFNRSTSDLIDADHVYGFCYAYSRDALRRGAVHDRVLLARDYSSGNRIETDHCLTARRLGFRVVYDGSTAVRHLAGPRPDMNERSLRWKLNHTRNTLYLFLKHYGLFSKRAMALRFTFLMDVGLLSAIRHPSKANWLYFLTGLRARSSAFFHYAQYLVRR